MFCESDIFQTDEDTIPLCVRVAFQKNMQTHITKMKDDRILEINESLPLRKVPMNVNDDTCNFSNRPTDFVFELDVNRFKILLIYHFNLLAMCNTETRQTTEKFLYYEKHYNWKGTQLVTLIKLIGLKIQGTSINDLIEGRKRDCMKIV